MQANVPEGYESARKTFLAVSIACMAIYWPIPDFKGRTFKLCVLTRWDVNFCVRSSQLRRCGRRTIPNAECIVTTTDFCIQMCSDVIHTEEDEQKWIRTWVRRVATHAAITRSAHIQAYGVEMRFASLEFLFRDSHCGLFREIFPLFFFFPRAFNPAIFCYQPIGNELAFPKRRSPCQTN